MALSSTTVTFRSGPVAPSAGAAAPSAPRTPNAIAAAIRALVARGLLERKPDTRDGRVSRLHPTPKAQAIRRQREGAWGELLRARLAKLHPEDSAQLLASVDSLRALAGNLTTGD